MSKTRIDIEPTFSFRCYLTEESAEWESRYCPDKEQITLTNGSLSGTFQMSVETARAVAYTILAAVKKSDGNKLYKEIITPN